LDLNPSPLFPNMPLYNFFCLPGFADSMVRSCILEPFDVTILFSTENEMYADFHAAWSCNLVLAMKRTAAKNKSIHLYPLYILFYHMRRISDLYLSCHSFASLSLSNRKTSRRVCNCNHVGNEELRSVKKR
jgi:hypothetical protein